MKPITRQEQLLDSIATGNSVELEPITREEQYLSAIAGLTDFIPEKPITRKEMFYKKILENGGGGGGTSEGVNLSYTLNKDGTYSSKSASKDSVFPSGNWYAKFIYVSDKTYTIEELIGHTIRTKEINVPTGVINEVRDIEITRDMITDIGNGTFAIIDSASGLPLLTIITEEMVGVDIGGGFVLPSNVGTYLVYADKSPDKQGYVIGSVSVKKTIGKPYIDTSLMTSFHRLFYNGANLEIIDNIDTSNGTSFEETFSGCNMLSSIPQLDTSNGAIFSNMFRGCSRLTNLPQLDTSKGTRFNSMFYSCTTLPSIPQLETSEGTTFNSMFEGCKAITSVPPLDTSKGTSFSSMFSGCSALETVSLTTAQKDLSTGTFYDCTALKNLTIGEGWAVSIYLNYSNNLTVESLHGMIENLADLTGQTAKTFQIGATNLAKIDEEHIAMLQAKNWNYS